MPTDPARIAVARDLLDQLGVTLADLQHDKTPTSVVPTLADYLPRVIAAAGPGANRTYGSYWTRMAASWGARPLDRISASDIEAMQHQMAATARSRRNSRHGRHAGEHVIAAARAIYNPGHRRRAHRAGREPSPPGRQAAQTPEHPPGLDRP